MQVAEKMAQECGYEAGPIRSSTDEGAGDLAVQTIASWWSCYVRLSSWWAGVVLFQRLYYPGSFRRDDSATDDRRSCTLHAEGLGSGETR